MSSSATKIRKIIEDSEPKAAAINDLLDHNLYLISFRVSHEPTTEAANQRRADLYAKIKDLKSKIGISEIYQDHANTSDVLISIDKNSTYNSKKVFQFLKPILDEKTDSLRVARIDPKNVQSF
jgi:hypothetical protein